jgi:hypothetical protein
VEPKKNDLPPFDLKADVLPLQTAPTGKKAKPDRD